MVVNKKINDIRFNSMSSIIYLIHGTYCSVITYQIDKEDCCTFSKVNKYNKVTLTSFMNIPSMIQH